MLGDRSESAIHETGWANPWPYGYNFEQTGCSMEKADLDQQVLQEAFGLMKKSAARLFDTAKRPGIDTNTPNCLKNAKKPLVLKEYQDQALNKFLDDYAAGGTGMLQGLEMGTGKTVITLAFLGSLKRKPNIPHLIVVPASLLDIWENETRNRLQPVPIFCVYLRLRTTDEYDGKLVADFKEAITVIKRHDLSSQEADLQEKTVTIWDKARREEHKELLKAGQDDPSPSVAFAQAFKEITDARLAIVHHLCPKYRYGERGDRDFVLREEQADKLPEEIQEAINKMNSKSSSVADKNRIVLRTETKRAWKESSPRMNAFVACCQKQQKEHPGPIFVFSEFLSALDVAHNALEETFGKKRFAMSRPRR